MDRLGTTATAVGVKALGVSLVATLMLLLLPPAAATASPGPDPFGYRSWDNVTGGLTWSWTSIVGLPGAQSHVLGDDDFTNPAVPIGFTFPYYGNTYTSAFIGSNGYISFGSGYTTIGPGTIPSAGTPLNEIAAYWEDLFPPAGGYIASLQGGTAPGRWFTVEWSLPPWPSSTPLNTFQATIHESGAIEVRLKEILSPTGTIGIENASGTVGLQYMSSAPTMTDRIIRFSRNLPPVAGDDSLSTVEDGGTQSLFVLANDSDPEGDALSIAGVGTPSYGSAGIGGVPPSQFLTYTPAPDKWTPPGTPDSFTYTLADAEGNVALGKVQVTILPRNDPPTMNPGVDPQVFEDAAEEVILGWADMESLSVGPPDEAGQTLVSMDVVPLEPAMFASGPFLNLAGDLRFTPGPDRCTDDDGTPVFLQLTDDGGTENGGQDTTPAGAIVFNIRIDCEPDAPIAVRDELGPFLQSTPPVELTLDVLANDEDADFETPGDTLRVAGLTAPTTGTVTPAVDELTVRFTPEPGTGPVAFQYRAKDDFGFFSNWQTTEVRIVCPTLILGGDAFAVTEDLSLTVPAPGILSNDQLPASPLQVSVYEPPSKGGITLAGDGSFVYTPDQDMMGADSFRYQVLDPSTGCRDVVRVHFTIINTNDPPTARGDVFVVAEDAVDVPLDVLANDSDDPDEGETLSILEVSPPARGQVRIDSGTVLYRARLDDVLDDEFTYTITDGHGGLASAKARVKILASPDAPRGVPDAYTVRPNQWSWVGEDDGVLHNDLDPDGDSLFVSLASAPMYGRVELEASGAFRYMPARDYRGSDVFTYTVRDSTDRFHGPITVRILVADNDQPTAFFELPESQFAVGTIVRPLDASLDDGRIEAYQWDFGDGTIMAGRDSEHAYNAPGIYLLRLTVVDNDGRLASYERLIRVVGDFDDQNGGRVAFLEGEAIVEPRLQVLENERVTLRAASPTGAPVVWAKWRQLEGPSVTLDNALQATSRFKAPEVSLQASPVRLAFEVVVFDGQVQTLPTRVVVDVYDVEMPPNVAVLSAGVDGVVVAGSRLTLEPVVVGGVADVSWRQVAGPSVGALLPGRQIVSVPMTPGEDLIFEASSVVDGRVLVDEVAFHVISAQELEGFSLARGQGRSSNSIQVTPLVPGSYEWHFGDGTTSTDVQPSHTYERSGVYDVVLRVTIPGAGVQHDYAQSVDVHVSPSQTSEETPGVPLGLLILGLFALLWRKKR